MIISAVAEFMLLGTGTMTSNISADTSGITIVPNLVQMCAYQNSQSITGGFDGSIIYEGQPISPAIPVQATEFKPQTVVIDIYEADTINFKWGVGGYNLTTMEEEVPFVQYVSGTSKMILTLKNAKIGVYLKATSGEGHVNLRATLSR